MFKKCFSFFLVVAFFLVLPVSLSAGLFDRDDEPFGALLGYKQYCPVRGCSFFGVANGDLDAHMSQIHPKRYEAALFAYNKSTFEGFKGVFNTLYAASSGGFKGGIEAVHEFYNALLKAGAGGRDIANILSSDEYD